MKYRDAVMNGWKVAFPVRHEGAVAVVGRLCDAELRQGGGRRKRLMYVVIPDGKNHHIRLYMRKAA